MRSVPRIITRKLLAPLGLSFETFTFTESSPNLSAKFVALHRISFLDDLGHKPFQQCG
jgi:hypothetical protein